MNDLDTTTKKWLRKGLEILAAFALMMTEGAFFIGFGRAGRFVGVVLCAAGAVGFTVIWCAMRADLKP